MKRITVVRRVKVSADGQGVVSHGGIGLLREVADQTGLVPGQRRPDRHLPGSVVYGPGRVRRSGCRGGRRSGLHAVGAACCDRRRPVRSGRVDDHLGGWSYRVDPAHLPGAGGPGWRQAEGVGRRCGSGDRWRLHLDFDATITISHSDEGERSRYLEKHVRLSLPAVLPGPSRDRLRRSARRSAASRATPGPTPPPTTSSSWTGAGVATRPLTARTRTARRAAAAGPLRLRRGHPHVRRRVPGPRRQVLLRVPRRRTRTGRVDLIPDGWSPAIQTDGNMRDGAWVAEATDLVDLSGWPAGTRLILRKERPHPGAQLRFNDVDGMRVTAFITDTPPRVVPGQVAGLELRHRQHARVEDRIRQAKATGLRGFPCHRNENNALAGDRTDRGRPGLLDQADLLRRPPRPRPRRDRHLPLPGPARRRPHHPRRPPAPPAHRRHMAVGHPHCQRLHRLRTAFT